jgi:hypothetical protein
MISFTTSGSFQNAESFLRKMSKFDPSGVLKQCGQEGVTALASATPVDSGLAAHSWGYETGKDGRGYFIVWTNTDVENGFPVAIRLQYGYATGTGGYVQGRDYINPAIHPIFDMIADRVWKAVTSA